MRKPLSILSKQDVEKLCDEKHIFSVNGINCSIRLYLHSSDYFSILHDCHSYKYSDIRKSYMLIMDNDKTKLLRYHFNNCDEVEIIERSTNKKGVYKISLQGTLDGNIIYLYGDDVLEYNKIIKEHIKFLDDSREEYNKIDFKNNILIKATNDVSESAYHYLVSPSYQDGIDNMFYFKEHKYFDINYFNYICEKCSHKEFILIREYSGVETYTIYTKCKIDLYSYDSFTIVFKILGDGCQINLHNELKINPIKEYNKIKRLEKIEKILN